MMQIEMVASLRYQFAKDAAVDKCRLVSTERITAGPATITAAVQP